MQNVGKHSGTNISLAAKDGFATGAYEAAPAGEAKGAVVVIQEIFGVNGHIKEVVDGYAAAGFHCVAPKLFDRVERDIELGYEGDDMQRGIDLAFNHTDRANALLDVQAAIDHLRSASVQRSKVGVPSGEVGVPSGKVGVVGYCFGGLMTWLAACELDGVAAASAYYGGGVAGELERSANCPVMMHFGDQDAHIPLSDVDKVRAAQPAAEVHVYSADHGFNCDHRASFNAEAANTARTRTLDFFAKYLTS